MRQQLDDTLDELPFNVLETVARQDDDDDHVRTEEEDRRIVQRRIVSEQLKRGLMQGKKKMFSEKSIGPVVVKTLQRISSCSTAAGTSNTQTMSMNLEHDTIVDNVYIRVLVFMRAALYI